MDIRVRGWIRLWKSPSEGAIEFVLIEVRQSVVSKAPYPGLWCTRAFRKSEANDTIVSNANTLSIRVCNGFRPHALGGRRTKIDIREVTLGVDREVSGLLAGLGVDVVYLFS